MIFATVHNSIASPPNSRELRTKLSEYPKSEYDVEDDVHLLRAVRRAIVLRDVQNGGKTSEDDVVDLHLKLLAAEVGLRRSQEVCQHLL